MTLLIAFGPIHLALLVAYIALSVASFVIYGIDKSAARQGRWRTPEAVLHLVSVAGGWPGALVAQRVFRHKTRKQSFRAVFWGTVVINCAALAWFLAIWPAVSG